MSVLAWLKQRLQRDIPRLGRTKPQVELHTVFPLSLMPNLSVPDRQAYPPIISLAKADIYGYQMHCLLTYQGKAALDNFKSAPPNPWESFAELDPDTLGSLQGNIDFWCSYFWRPYWLSLSDAERLQYPENWREFSDYH